LLRALGSKPAGPRSGAGSDEALRACLPAASTSPAIECPTALSLARTRGGAVHVLARATSTASGFTSTPIARKPAARASTSVVPEPQNGSTSKPRGGIDSLTIATSSRAVAGWVRAG
jgi:hypothetical protein